jgi:hypothetical protein
VLRIATLSVISTPRFCTAPMLRRTVRSDAADDGAIGTEMSASWLRLW